MAPSALDRDHRLVLVHKTMVTALQKPYGFSALSERLLTYQTRLDSMFSPCAFYTATCQQLHHRMFGFCTVESGKFVPTFPISVVPPSSVPKTKYYNSRSWYSIVYYFFTRFLSVCYMLLCEVDAIHSQTSEKTTENTLKHITGLFSCLRGPVVRSRQTWQTLRR